MALLNFPPGAVDGQTSLQGNGVTYTYKDPPGVWTAPYSGGGPGPVPGDLTAFDKFAVTYANNEFVITQNKAAQPAHAVSIDGNVWVTRWTTPNPGIAYDYPTNIIPAVTQITPAGNPDYLFSTTVIYSGGGLGNITQYSFDNYSTNGSYLSWSGWGATTVGITSVAPGKPETNQIVLSVENTASPYPDLSNFCYFTTTVPQAGAAANRTQLQVFPSGFSSFYGVGGWAGPAATGRYYVMRPSGTNGTYIVSSGSDLSFTTNPKTTTVTIPGFGGYQPFVYKWVGDDTGNIVLGLSKTTQINVGDQLFRTADAGTSFAYVANPNGATSSIQGLAYGNGKFVMACKDTNPPSLSNGNAIYSSTDGLTWTLVQGNIPYMTGDGNVRSAIAFGAGTFVVLAGATPANGPILLT